MRWCCTKSECGDNVLRCFIDFFRELIQSVFRFNRYISLQATHPLGLRDEVRSEVERLICSKEEIIHCFGDAILDAFAFLHVTCLDGFLKSSLFLAFLSDLIGSLSSAKCQQTIGMFDDRLV
jgi:hypothetical protein